MVIGGEGIIVGVCSFVPLCPLPRELPTVVPSVEDTAVTHSQYSFTDKKHP